MFDIGFTELMLLGVVALLVLGPERLPAAARTAGVLLRRARNSYQSLKSDIERELAAEEMRNSVKAMREPLQSIQDTAAELNRGAAELTADLKRSDPIAEPNAEPNVEPKAADEAGTEPAAQPERPPADSPDDDASKRAAAKVDADDAFLAEGPMAEQKANGDGDTEQPPATEPKS